MIDKIGSGFKDYAPFVLRMGLAVIFIVMGSHEIHKLWHYSPSIWEVMAVAIELVGGLFVLIGFFTRWAAFAMLVLVIVHLVRHLGFRAFVEPEHQLWFALLVTSFALFGLGGGKWSVDASNKKKQE